MVDNKWYLAYNNRNTENRVFVLFYKDWGRNMAEMQKKAVLISCTDHFRERTWIFEQVLRDLGYQTQYLAADFHHIRKEYFRCTVNGANQLHVRSYRKNLSPSRILSHLDFAKGVYRYLESLPEEPELIVSEIPPNFLARYLAKYKKHHPRVKLVFDIFDLWPETFPSGKAKKLLAPFFAVWARLRNRSLPAADRILTECDLFRQKLGLTEEPKCSTLYLTVPDDRADRFVCLPEDCISLCYLGSVNNIIDIPAICSLVTQLQKRRPVRVNVIGRGERLEEFLTALRQTGAQVCYHGAVFDTQQKQDIIARCHFGLNIMKSSVCIGLTMKSVDYWSHGLPVLNNVPADTAKMVEERGIGVNLSESAAETVCSMTREQMLAMRERVNDLFADTMSQGVISEKLAAILKEILL